MKRRNRTATGIKGIPTSEGFYKCSRYFQYDLDTKDVAKILKAFVKKNYSRQDADAIFANAEWNFYAYTGIVCAAYCIENNIEFPPEYSRYPEEVGRYLGRLLTNGNQILEAKAIAEQGKVQQRVYSPRERLQMKIQNTILADVDSLEEQWYNGEKAELDIVARMRVHELKGMAVEPVVSYLRSLLPEYQDAHSGACKDAKQGYEHLGKRELTRRIKCLGKMITDLEQFKANQSTKRKRKIK